MRVMECINIRPEQIGTEKKANCKFTNVQVLNLLMLFPFFVVRNAYRYSGSSLGNNIEVNPKYIKMSESERFAHMFDKSIGLVRKWSEIRVGLVAA